MNILKKLIGNPLNQVEGQDLMLSILNRELGDVEIASILTWYEAKGFTNSEFLGFIDGVTSLSNKVDLSDFKTLDICGTGGDGKNTFNISTTAAFILAAGGVKVAKHGNYGSSSICGSSNVLDYLGYKFTDNEDVLKQQLDSVGITFLHAPLFHPKLKDISHIRKEMGIGTIFNLLGPICNPCKPNYSVIGVSHRDSWHLGYEYRKILEKNCDKFAIITDSNHYDEISLTGMFDVLLKEVHLELEAEDFNFKTIEGCDILGGETVRESADIMKHILSGNGTNAQNSVVAMNAGVGFMLYEDIGFGAGVDKAMDIIKSGKGFQLLEKLINLDNSK